MEDSNNNNSKKNEPDIHTTTTTTTTTTNTAINNQHGMNGDAISYLLNGHNIGNDAINLLSEQLLMLHQNQIEMMERKYQSLMNQKIKELEDKLVKRIDTTLVERKPSNNINNGLDINSNNNLFTLFDASVSKLKRKVILNQELDRDILTQRLKAMFDREFPIEIKIKEDELIEIDTRISKVKSMLNQLSRQRHKKSSQKIKDKESTSTTTSTLTTKNNGSSKDPAQDTKLYYRKQDGSFLWLKCPECGKEKFVNKLGFVNHCRILHRIRFPSYDAAADACGTPVDASEVPLNDQSRILPTFLSDSNKETLELKYLNNSNNNTPNTVQTPTKDKARETKAYASIKPIPSSSSNPSTISSTPVKEVAIENNSLDPSNIQSNASINHPPMEESLSRFYIKKRIFVGNTCAQIHPDNIGEDKATHKWMVYVRGSENDSDISYYVKKIWFYLHDSFAPNNLIEITHPPFQLTRRGWGEFRIRIKLFFHDHRNKPLNIYHTLKLNQTPKQYNITTLGEEHAFDLDLDRQFFEQREQKLKQEQLAIQVATPTTTTTTTNTTNEPTPMDIDNKQEQVKVDIPSPNPNTTTTTTNKTTTTTTTPPVQQKPTDTNTNIPTIKTESNQTIESPLSPRTPATTTTTTTNNTITSPVNIPSPTAQITTNPDQKPKFTLETPSVQDILNRYTKYYPIISNGEERKDEITYRMAETKEEWLDWEHGKQKLSEYRRSRLITKRLNKQLSTSFRIHDIAQWCRENDKTPLTASQQASILISKGLKIRNQKDKKRDRTDVDIRETSTTTTIAIPHQHQDDQLPLDKGLESPSPGTKKIESKSPDGVKPPQQPSTPSKSSTSNPKPVKKVKQEIVPMTPQVVLPDWATSLFSPMASSINSTIVHNTSISGANSNPTLAISGGKDVIKKTLGNVPLFFCKYCGTGHQPDLFDSKQRICGQNISFSTYTTLNSTFPQIRITYPTNFNPDAKDINPNSVETMELLAVQPSNSQNYPIQFIRNIVRQIGIDLSRGDLGAEEVIYTSAVQFMRSLILDTFEAYSKEKEKEPKEECTVKVIVPFHLQSAIRSNPLYNFLSNCALHK